MRILRLTFGLFFDRLVASIAAFLAAVFAIPAGLLDHVRMTVADHAAKLGRDLKARRLMSTLALLQTGPHPAYV
jgi:hypothetical protein